MRESKNTASERDRIIAYSKSASAWMANVTMVRKIKTTKRQALLYITHGIPSD